jgi:limonene 1,2-monooxygenase
MQSEVGGFGGLLLSTHEWTSTEKLRRSYELFARYVIPHFRGHTRGYHDEWRAIQNANSNGGFKLVGPGEPSNLALRDGSGS